MPQSFELLINIKHGSIAGGGLKRDGYVETYLNGQLFDTTDTVPPPHRWDQQLYRSFSDGYAEASQTVLSFAVYKRRWTSFGFKLVGTLDIPLVRLIPLLNNGSHVQSHALKQARKNVTMTGELTIELELKESDVFISPSSTMQYPKEGSEYKISNRQSFMDKNSLSYNPDWYISDRSSSSTDGESPPAKLNLLKQGYDTEEESTMIISLTAACFCRKTYMYTCEVPKQIKYCHCLNCQSASGGPYLLKYEFDPSMCS
jgi:hypothetical protein